MVGGCGDYEDGEYYDVVAGNCTIRFDLNSTTSTVYAGRTIMHCHILEHEDQGAMGWADVVGGAAAPTFPASTSFQAYYNLGAVINPPVDPGSLVANTISSSQIDLNWSDNSADESGFTIKRSTDGVMFAYLADVSANTTNYLDSGLTSDTLYYYQVFAWNSGGNSGFSNISNATTSTAVDPTSTLVGSITVSTINIGQGNKIGRAFVVVTDDQGGLVSGATVSGEFTGTFNETVTSSTITDSNGSTSFDTSNSVKGSVALTFCVTSIAHPTLQDFTSAPGAICSSL